MEVIPLKSASSYFYSRPCYQTLSKWCRKGVWNDALHRYVVLDSFLEGRRRFTSVEAIEKFKREVNGVEEESHP